MTELDDLDQLAAEVFEGYLVRKDLAQQFRGQYPVPTYVGEFLLGRYCATTDPDEIAEGLAVVERSMKERTVRAGEEELFKSRAREKGRVKIIDLLRAGSTPRPTPIRPSSRASSSPTSTSPTELVNEHDRMLTGGFYAEVTLEYIAALAKESGGQPFRVESIATDPDVDPGRPRHVRRRTGPLHTRAMARLCCCAALASSPTRFTPRQQDILLLRMVPFVVTNYNAVELGPRGTGKSHLFQQISPYAHLVSGGKATIANMFVNNQHRSARAGGPVRRRLLRRGLRRLLRSRRRASTSSRATWSPASSAAARRASAPRAGSSWSATSTSTSKTSSAAATSSDRCPRRCATTRRSTTASMPTFPAGTSPSSTRRYFTNHFGFVSDFLAECWSQLRRTSRLEVTQGRLEWGEPAERPRPQGCRTTRSMAC